MWNVISGNRLLARRRKEQSHRKHIQTLKKIRPVIQNRPPTYYSFLETRPKAKMQKYEREMQIENNNEQLVNRMMRSSSYIKAGESNFKQSLNSIYRNKIQRQIDSSNQILIGKLQTVKSQYGQAIMAKSLNNYHRYKSNLAQSRMAPTYDLENASASKDRPSSAYV